MKAGVVAGLIACGCGDVVGNPSDDAPNGDALLARCDVTKPFAAPVRVGGVNTDVHDFWGAMSDDLRTLYFTRFESGTAGILYAATRSDPTAPFSGVTPLGGGVNTANDEQRPTLTADGRVLFFQIPSEPSGHFDLFTATRASAAGDFPATPPERVSISTTGAHDWDPMISDDGLTLYFASTRSTNGAVDSNLFRAERDSTTAPFRAPEAIAELNTTGAENAPVPSRDGLEIFFEKQAGSTRQIFHATRASPTAAFGAPREVAELNDRVNNRDYPNWISPDHCHLLFSSERPGGSGLTDLWIATRPR